MKEKWLFFDIDGTIAPTDGAVSPANRAALRRAAQAGHHLMINTGRSLGYLYRSIIETGFEGIVAGMGSQIVYRGKTVYEDPLDPAFMRAMIERWMTEREACVVLEGRLANYTILRRDEKLPPHMRYGHPILRDWRDAEWVMAHERLSKMTIFEHREDVPADMLEQLSAETDMIDQGYYQEVLKRGCGKGKAIEWICREWGIDIKDTIAFGDSWNDEEMLRTAGYAVVTETAPNEIKAMATEVTGGCEEGVGRWIERNLL